MESAKRHLLLLDDFGISSEGLLAWWRHDEGTGLVIKDSKNGYNGTGVGLTWGTCPDGVTPFAWYLPTDYTHGIGNVLKITGGFTIMVAIRPNVLVANRCIIAKRRGAGGTQRCNYQLLLAAAPDEIGFFFTEGDTATWASYVTTNLNMQVNSWYFVTISYTFGDAGSMKVYKGTTLLTGGWGAGGGVGYNSNELNYVILGSMNDNNPGQDIGTANWWEGGIGDLLLYNKTLVLPEITQTYNALKPRYLLA